MEKIKTRITLLETPKKAAAVGRVFGREKIEFERVWPDLGQKLFKSRWGEPKAISVRSLWDRPSFETASFHLWLLGRGDLGAISVDSLWDRCCPVLKASLKRVRAEHFGLANLSVLADEFSRKRRAQGVLIEIALGSLSSRDWNVNFAVERSWGDPGEIALGSLLALFQLASFFLKG